MRADLATLAETNRACIRTIIDTSLKRLGMERLDLVQFHWWDYAVSGCTEVAAWLLELQREGKIDRLGGTNFDAQHTAELIDAGLDLVTMQVQYSLIDNRPEHGLVDLCRKRGVQLLCLWHGCRRLSFRPLARRCQSPEPPFENRSLTKYKLIIDDFGGWDLFQELLRVAPPDRRSSRHRHRVHREPRHPRPSYGRGRDCRGAQSIAR